MSEELQEVVSNSQEWYQAPMTLEEIDRFIIANINTAKRSFIAIGYYLKYVRDRQLYKDGGFSGVLEYAKAKFGIGASQASKYMSINDKFSVNGNSPILLEKYQEFDKTQLSEMLYLTNEQLEQVSVGMTKVEIREIGSPEKVLEESSFSPAKMEPEPEVSSVYPKLCKHDGKSNCVATCNTGAGCCGECPEYGHCNGECGWVDERMPKQNPSGKCIHRSEFTCTLPEASKLAIGDGVACNAKCCWSCPKHGDCGYECNSSAHRPVESHEEDVHDERWFVRWYFDKHPNDLKKLFEISNKTKVPGDIAKAFQKYRSPYGALNNYCSEYEYSFHNFAGGIDFRVDKEKIHMKYGRFVKEALDIYIDILVDDGAKSDNAQFSANDTPETVDNQPETVDDVEEEVVPEKGCHDCNYNTMSLDEYRAQYPEAEEHPCNDCDDKLDQWAPKVDNAKKAIEKSDFPCDTCGHDINGCCDYDTENDWCEMGSAWISKEPEQVETVEADIIQTVPEDPERYTRLDVREELDKLTEYVESYRKDGGNFPGRRKAKMRLDAITLLAEEMQKPAGAEPPKPVQPELPQEAIEAMQFRTPKKMVNAGDDLYKCPTCKAIQVAEFWSKKIYSKYCPVCGQALEKLDAKTKNPDRM